MQELFKILRTHIFLTCLFIVGLAVAVWWGYGKFANSDAQTRYITARVERGTLVASVTGSGQVSASTQIDLKPKVAGDVITLAATDGQNVYAGMPIALLDSRDAHKAVRDAQVDLQGAQIALAKLQKPVDTLALLQAENAIIQSEQTKEKAKSDLQKAYEDAFSAIANTFLDLPTVMTGMQDILYENTINQNQDNISAYTDLAKTYDEKILVYRDNVSDAYRTSRTAYDKNFVNYKAASRYASTTTVDALLQETYDTTKLISDTVKSTSNFVNFVKDEIGEHNKAVPPLLDTHISTLADYTNKTNSHLLNLLNIKNTIKNAHDTITGSNRDIAEKQASLEKLRSGTDALDIESARLTLKQRENALVDAQEKLADYTVRIPFDGTIARVSVKKFDAVAPSTIVATLITRQKLAEISLNEVDAAKIKIGQKATLTFDAIENLSIAGSVAQIDAVGTVTQGVVTYRVTIGFDTQDERVKPGMSVSAAIITDIAQDVLMVPGSAIKSQDNVNYVEIFDPPLTQDRNSQGIPSPTLPGRRQVSIGLVNDTDVAIISGIREGEQIVVRTVNLETNRSPAQQAPSLFGTPGARGSGVRVPR